MSEKTYTIIETVTPNGLTIWEVVVDGYGLTLGLTLTGAINNLDPYVYE